MLVPGRVIACGDGGPVLATQSRSVELKVDAEVLANGSYLQIAAMIGRSNDSFVSIEPFNLLALSYGGNVTLKARNFDAGSEENTGNVTDFGPGGHPMESAEGHVTFDRGLILRGDAPESWGWSSVAAFVTIERL